MERLNEIKKLVRTLNEADYRNLVIALMINEKMDYVAELADLTEDDLNDLDEIYNEYMEQDGVQLLDEYFYEKMNEVEEEEE